MFLGARAGGQVQKKKSFRRGVFEGNQLRGVLFFTIYKLKQNTVSYKIKLN